MDGPSNQNPYSINIHSGVLVTCDSAATQILKFVDRQRDGPSKFIIREIDDTHLLVKQQYVEHIKDVLQEELEKNTYSQDPKL